MSSLKYLIVAILLVGLGFLGYFYVYRQTDLVVVVHEQTDVAPGEVIIEPEEAVLKTVATSSTDSQGLNVALNETVDTIGVYLTPSELIEDSRCPADVACIQAGTVRVRATIVTPTEMVERTFALGNPVSLEDFTVTLLEVTPFVESKLNPKDIDYRFRFTIVAK